MEALVGGVIVDEAVLMAADDDVDGLRASAHSVLRRLRFSKLPLAISYAPSISNEKKDQLTALSSKGCFDCFALNGSSMDDAVSEITRAWGDIRGTVLYLVSNCKETFAQLSELGRLIIVTDNEDIRSYEDSGIVCIRKLEELLMTVCHGNKKVVGDGAVIVGYVMKPSREEDFARRGAFPMNPTPNGLMFLPLTVELPLLSQLQHVGMVLHKATDEIISVELNVPSELLKKITYSTRMHELQRYTEGHSDCLLIDPLDKIYPVVDRLKIQQILLGLEELCKEGHSIIRGPHFLKVDDFNEPDLKQRLSEAKLSLPSIVKPQVACGVAHAHSMAIIFRVEDFKDLKVPLPAVVQEYVDHSSTLFKIYVLGKKVFHAVKNSIPNADVLLKSSERNGFKPLIFDSLKSLPTSSEHSRSRDSLANGHLVDLELVKDAANWLARKLDLTIFGFDVIIQEETGDHVIVDVNYLPSFKEVPDDVAIPAFWDAIKQKFERREEI